MNTPEDPISPYQPPASDLSQPVAATAALPPHERSAAPKVFGVLSIIFASIQLLFSTGGLLFSATAGAAGSAGSLAAEGEKGAELNAMVRPMAKILEGIGFQSLILFVMSALLLAIGIGQLRYRGWARRWSVYWAGTALACVGALAAISLLIISPGYAELFASAASLGKGAPDIGSMGSFNAWFGGTFAVMCVVIYTPFPGLMLLFFTREHVRASMTD